MNYLAHAYLSFGDPQLLAGNMVSDFVKGKRKFDYPLGIQQGIALHREIDAFTDDHPATREAKEIFRPDYRLYAGAFMDVVYDHFLAVDENEFTTESLVQFADQTYSLLEPQLPGLPDRFRQLFPYMKQQNWLANYRFRPAIEKSMGGLVRRAAYLTDASTAFRLFEAHYDHLKHCYGNFFPALKSFVIGNLPVP